MPDGSRADTSVVTSQVLRIYLGEALEQAPATGAVLLGCTHYPLLRGAIERTLGELGHPVPVIDSAQATAEVVAEELGVRRGGGPVTPGRCEFFATDSVAKFGRLGTRFLGRPVEDVRLVDLGG
jgi:glutamate racemase